MKKAKYTQGPWNVGLDDEPMEGVEGIEISGDGNSMNVGYAMSLNDELKICNTTRANARLMAAAPQMLEALLAASDWIDAQLGEPRTEIQAIIQQAIADATGEACGFAEPKAAT